MSILDQNQSERITIGETYDIYVDRKDWSYPWITMLTELKKLETLDPAVIKKLIETLPVYFNYKPDYVVQEHKSNDKMVYGCAIWQKCTSFMGIDTYIGEVRINKKS